MPRYDYRCENCGETFEVRASMADYASLEPRCTHCDSSRVSRVFTGLNILAGQSSASSGGGYCQPSGFG